jgi:hypothetical protein
MSADTIPVAYITAALLDTLQGIRSELAAMRIQREREFTFMTGKTGSPCTRCGHAETHNAGRSKTCCTWDTCHCTAFEGVGA